MIDVIRAEGEKVVTEFVAWVRAQPGVRLVAIEGYPGSGKSHLLERLPPEWPRIELDKLIGKNHDETVGWIDLVRQRGAEEVVRAELQIHSLVIVEGPAAWPALQGLLSELGPAARRVYMQHWPISGGVPHWTEGGSRQLCVDTANHEFWRDIMRHHAEEPEREADLVIQRISAEPTPDSLFEELSALGTR